MYLFIYDVIGFVVRLSHPSMGAEGGVQLKMPYIEHIKVTLKKINIQISSLKLFRNKWLKLT